MNNTTQTTITPPLNTEQNINTPLRQNQTSATPKTQKYIIPPHFNAKEASPVLAPATPPRDPQKEELQHRLARHKQHMQEYEIGDDGYYLSRQYQEDKQILYDLEQSLKELAP